jgi:hypothetical protein
MPLFLIINFTNNAYIYRVDLQNSLAGFEPGSSAPQSDAMATAPRRHFGRFQPANPEKKVAFSARQTFM